MAARTIVFRLPEARLVDIATGQQAGAHQHYHHVTFREQPYWLWHLDDALAVYVHEHDVVTEQAPVAPEVLC